MRSKYLRIICKRATPNSMHEVSNRRSNTITNVQQPLHTTKWSWGGGGKGRGGEGRLNPTVRHRRRTEMLVESKMYYHLSAKHFIDPDKIN